MHVRFEAFDSNGFEILVNNDFVNDSLLSMSAKQGLVEGALACLDMFCACSGSVVNNYPVGCTTELGSCCLDPYPAWDNCDLSGHSFWDWFAAYSYVGLVSSEASELVACLVS